MIYCTSCLTPSTRPRIRFVDGKCNACVHAEQKASSRIDYNERHNEFKSVLEEISSIRRFNDQPYDCVVPWSGGKDSSAVALQLKYTYGLNPLLVTFSPLLPTMVGVSNREALIENGFDSILSAPNKKVSSLLSLRFFIERGNPKLHWNAGINSNVIKIAHSYGIKYIFYAEHGETNYGGIILASDSEKVRGREEILENQIGDDPANWQSNNISLRDLYPYTLPSYELSSDQAPLLLYFGYFHQWSILDNLALVESKIKFCRHPQGRTPGTFTDFDSLDDYMDDVYYYMQYIKYGFGRAIRDLSRQIQLNNLTRERALELARLYDGEFPQESFERACEFWGISMKECLSYIDSHRPATIWDNINGEWQHKYAQALYNNLL